MRVLARLLFLIICVCAGPGAAHEIVDMTGRHIDVPDKINRVFVASYPLTILFYAFAPDLLIAINQPLNEAAKPYVPNEIAILPAIGGVPGQGRSLNKEEVMVLRPDVILAWVDPFGGTEQTQKQFAATGIPIIFVKMDKLSEYPQALRFLGKLFERQSRGETLASYIENALTRVEQAVVALPPEKQVRIYYAESPEGLATECDDSFHIEAIWIAGGENVHHCSQSTHLGLEKVNLEQIIEYRPGLILSQDRRFSEAVRTDPSWRNVLAVAKGNIVNIPHLPFNWIDRPPSFMRALGIQWLANLFYPDVFPLDLKAETKNFYSLFLGVELSDADIDRILR